MDRLQPIHYFGIIVVFLLATLGLKAIFALLLVFLAFIVGFVLFLIN